MSPSIDLFGVTDRLVEDAKSRCREAHREPGGGGINVARNLHRFGADVQALFVAGGLNGQQLEQALEREGLRFQVIPSRAETRQNFAVTAKATDKFYHFVFPGPALEEAEWKACLEAIERLEPTPDYLVISGSLPAAVPDDFFGWAVASAKAKGICVVLDTSGAALLGAAGKGVYLAKLNLKELALLGYQGPSDNRSRLDAMQDMAERGSVSDILVVTLGAEGALLASRNGHRLHLAPPPTHVVSHVGAGDGFVSSLVYQLHRGRPLDEALRYGVAGAAAAISTPGNQIDDFTTVERIVHQVEAR